MTQEEHVAYALLKLYRSLLKVDVISFHPPSGKAYETPLVRFPVLKNIAIASKRRHLDFIVRCGRFLILQELKGDANSLVDDFVKLRALRDELGLNGILKTIAKRVPSIKNSPNIDRIILSVGCYDHKSVLPLDFTAFRVNNNGEVIWSPGSDLSLDERRELEIFLGCSKE